MANISKIKLPNVGTPYNIADSTARSTAVQAATDAETALQLLMKLKLRPLMPKALLIVKQRILLL